jgi:NAD-dependent SIR2 family protein deacetylase
VCNHPDGIIKPDIVFFGENLGNKFADLLEVDRQKCDLVIVIGSSLQVNALTLYSLLIQLSFATGAPYQL